MTNRGEGVILSQASLNNAAGERDYKHGVADISHCAGRKVWEFASGPERLHRTAIIRRCIDSAFDVSPNLAVIFDVD